MKISYAIPVHNEHIELEKLLSQASGNKPISIGTPAKFRKWFTARKGRIHTG